MVSEMLIDRQSCDCGRESCDNPTDAGMGGNDLTTDGSSDLDDLSEIADEVVVTILDWDDTLCPTRYIKSVARPFTAEPGLLSIDFQFHDGLHHHADLVAKTLRAARALGRVVIVTLAERGWVLASAERFLPGLDLQRLLDELDIPIYYAAEHVQRSVSRLVRKPTPMRKLLAEGIDVQKMCKQAAMEKCLRYICRKRQVRLNVISIGDSAAGREAIKDAMWSPVRAGLPMFAHLCKTVKLAEAPSLVQMGCQLRSLIDLLPRMVDCLVEFDHILDDCLVE